jgi:hypothetical protein
MKLSGWYDVLSLYNAPLCLVHIADQINKIGFFPWKANHLDLENNFDICGDSWFSSRSRSSFLAESELTLSKKVQHFLSLNVFSEFHKRLFVSKRTGMVSFQRSPRTINGSVVSTPFSRPPDPRRV